MNQITATERKKKNKRKENENIPSARKQTTLEGLCI